MSKPHIFFHKHMQIWVCAERKGNKPTGWGFTPQHAFNSFNRCLAQQRKLFS